MKKTRDLTKAVTLRPNEVFQLYGIPANTVGNLCRHEDPTRRLPSTLIQGRKGRKGLRLINHDELRTYLGSFRTVKAS